MAYFIRIFLVRYIMKYRESHTHWQIRGNFHTFWAEIVQQWSVFFTQPYEMLKIFIISWATVPWWSEFFSPECGIVLNSIHDASKCWAKTSKATFRLVILIALRVCVWVSVCICLMMIVFERHIASSECECLYVCLPSYSTVIVD